MADVAGGKITWVLDVDDSAFNSKVAAVSAKANALGQGIGNAGTAGGEVFSSGLARMLSNVSNFAGNASQAFGSVADGIAGFASKFRFAGLAAAGALGLMAKNSISMVVSVQRSTLALASYTGSAKSAAKITGELIDFAKSDRGVLFNRDELLKTATLLKGAGLETKRLTGFIKAMAPAVAASGAQFDEIGQILSKVVATGKLSAIEFDQLADRGIVLDKSLRGTSISADELQKALSKAVPAEILDKQSKTVQGRFIRLQTAFRELGNELLGVTYGANEFGATFAPGSLGDTAIKQMMRLTEIMKDPEVKAGFKNLGESAKSGLKLAVDGLKLLLTNLDTVKAAIISMAGAWAVAKTASAGFKVVEIGGNLALLATGAGQAAQATSTLGTASQVAGTGIGAVGTAAQLSGTKAVAGAARFGVWAVVIAAVVAALIFLEVKFHVFSNAWKSLTTNPALIQMVGQIRSFVDSIISGAMPAIQKFKSTLSEVFGGIVSQVSPALAGLKSSVMGAFNAVKGALSGIDFGAVTSKISSVISAILDFVGKFAKIVGPVLGTVLSGYIKVISTVISTVGSVISRIIPIIAPVVSNIVDTFGPVVAFLAKAFLAVATVVAAVFIPVFKAIVAVIQFIAPIIGTIIVVAFTILAAVINIVVGAFKILFSVISFVVNIFIAIITTIVNVVSAILGFLKPALDVISKVWSTVWNAIKTVTSTVWNAIKSAVGVAVDFVKSRIQAGVNNVKAIWNGIVALYNKAKQVFGQIVSAVSGAIGRVVSFVRSIPGKAVSALAGAGKALYQKGRDLVQGLLDGVGSLAKNIGKWFLDKIPGWIKAPFKAALGISSPSKVFAGYGQNLMQGLVKGIAGSRGMVESEMDKLGSTLSPPGTGLGINTSVSGSTEIVSRGSSQTVVVDKVDISGVYARSRSDEREVGKNFLEAVNEELRAKGIAEIGGGRLGGTANA